MKSSGKVKNITVVAAMVMMLSGCNSSECLENSNALPLAGFYTSTINPDIYRITGMKVWGEGVPGDSVLSTGSSAISELYLPFNLEEDKTTYVFEYPEEGGSDTITFKYTRQPFFVSSECGAVVNFNIENITHTTQKIDSVTCPDGHITSVAVENIHIYFKYEDED